MVDDLTKALEDLTGPLPKARQNLSEAEKDALVALVGVRTTRQIIRAKSELPLRRIPFLFSSIDTQAVIDVLANDLTAALERAGRATGKSA